MTQQEFKTLLDHYGRFYREIEGRITIGGNREIWLPDIVELPSGVTFENNNNIWLPSVRRIPSDVRFHNEGAIQLKALLRGDYFHQWNGCIRGIESTMILNKMISDGLFDR
jgi:hypothetical protein